MVQAMLEWKEEKISGGDAGMRNKTNIQDIHRLAVCSDLRRNILISMYEGEKSLGDLRDELKISSTTAIHALRELEKVGLTFQGLNRNYALTNIGRITTLKLVDFSDATEVLKKHERFWLEHDLSGIPEHMMERIGWLRDSTLIEAQPTDIFKVYSTYVELLKKAKEVRGVTSMFVPEYSIIFKNIILMKKTNTKLVVTEEVLNKIDQEILKEIQTNESLEFELYILKENIKVGFTVTDYFLSLGLFNFDGSYDWNRDLISYNEKAIAWGYELFEDYIQKSDRVI